MSTEYTPGPWFTFRQGFSTIYVEARIGRGLVQEVAACGPTDAGQEQQEANARLIAAAPDLLAACRGLLAAHAIPSSICAERPAYEAALVAIAKATGEAA